MRRSSLAIAATIIALDAAALIGGAYAICRASEATDIVGEWATHGHAAHVRIEHCAAAPERFCGRITWLWEPIDARGQPVRDARNPDSALRQEPLVGLSILRDFVQEPGGESMSGWLYNPENGRTYHASLRFRGRDVLEVKGCVLFVCDTQVWRRVESLCRRVSTVGARRDE